ncbi:MAG: 2Fe-2S iron-sulfur cluster-binding protein, partial [Thermoleophilaceae bacterium]
MPSRVIELVVNDEPAEFLAPPGTTLLTTLRETLGLTAAKRGCAQGTCGTCTVLLDGRPVMACLVPVETINGASVQTLEGVSG